MLQETRAVAEAEKRLLLKTDCFQSNKKQTSLAFHTRFTFLAPHSSFFVSCMKRPFSGETSQLLFTGLHGLIWKNSRVHTAIAVFVSPLPLGWLGQPGDAWRGHCGGGGPPANVGGGAWKVLEMPLQAQWQSRNIQGHSDTALLKWLGEHVSMA